ncbi:MAG: Hydroxyacylglutathione hydrolase [Eggerthella lenta]
MAQVKKVKSTCVPVEFVTLGMLGNNVYIISDGEATIVVDPSCKADEILKAVGNRTVDAIVLTHRHSDHVGRRRSLRDKTGATVIASAIDAPIIEGKKQLPRDDMRTEPCPVDHVVSNGDIVKIGSMPWKVLVTPGTPRAACACSSTLSSARILRRSGADLGDTLFCGSIGGRISRVAT